MLEHSTVNVLRLHKRSYLKRDTNQTGELFAVEF